MLKQKGFTLLEAIVALILLATIGMALFSWINTNFISLYRIQQSQYRNEAIRNALAFIKTINPLERPQGEETLGVLTFRWQSEAAKLPKDGISPTGGVGLFQVALYDVKMEVSNQSEILARFTVRQVGYQQVRELPDF